jgi:hypothetical protein
LLRLPEARSVDEVTDKPRRIYSDDGSAFAVWENIMIAYFRDLATPTRMRAFRLAQKELTKNPDPVGCLVINAFTDGAKPELGEELRTEVIAAMTSYADRDAAVAVTVEGRGFLDAIVRTFIAGTVLMARPKFPVKIFGARSDAANWLVKSVDRGRGAVTSIGLLTTADETIALCRPASTQP